MLLNQPTAHARKEPPFAPLLPTTLTTDGADASTISVSSSASIQALVTLSVTFAMLVSTCDMQSPRLPDSLQKLAMSLR